MNKDKREGSGWLLTSYSHFLLTQRLAANAYCERDAIRLGFEIGSQGAFGAFPIALTL